MGPQDLPWFPYKPKARNKQTKNKTYKSKIYYTDTYTLSLNIKKTSNTTLLHYA